MRSGLSAIFLLLAVALTSGLECYNYAESTCCDGMVHPRPKDSEYQCCGTNLLTYDYDEWENNPDYVIPICCNDTVYERDNANIGCCGLELIDTATTACYNDTPVPIPEEAIAKGKLQICHPYLYLHRKSAPAPTCQYTFYKQGEEQCCDGTVHDNTLNSWCCGNDTYDYDSQLCCNDVVYNKTDENSTCCWDKVYNASSQFCCLNYEWNNEEPIWESKIHELNETSSENLSCCALGIYNYETQVCCDSGPRDKKDQYVAYCCGEDFITNTSTQLCVNNKVVPSENENMAVCGNEVYNVNEKACGRKGLVDLAPGQSLCWYNDEAYYPLSQVCTPKEIVTLSEDDIENDRREACVPFEHYRQYDETLQQETTSQPTK